MECQPRAPLLPRIQPLACGGHNGGVTNREPHNGDLLVASLAVSDGIFDHAVVYLIDVDEEGALGVVLNRKSDVALPGVLPGWEDLVSSPRVLYEGGPVMPQGAICLAATNDPAEEPPGWRRVQGNIGLLHLDTPQEIVDGAYQDIRIFAGYAGWSPWQLESEITRGMWHVVEAQYPDVFGPSPWNLWRRVLHRQGGPLATYATWTVDPRLN